MLIRYSRTEREYIAGEKVLHLGHGVESRMQYEAKRVCRTRKSNISRIHYQSLAFSRTDFTELDTS